MFLTFKLTLEANRGHFGFPFYFLVVWVASFHMICIMAQFRCFQFSGHQRSLETIRGHQRSLEALEVIKGHQRSLEAIRRSNMCFLPILILCGLLAYILSVQHYCFGFSIVKSFRVINGHWRSLEVISMFLRVSEQENTYRP